MTGRVERRNFTSPLSHLPAEVARRQGTVRDSRPLCLSLRTRLFSILTTCMAFSFEASSCKATPVGQLHVCSFHHLNYSMQKTLPRRCSASRHTMKRLGFRSAFVSTLGKVVLKNKCSQTTEPQLFYIVGKPFIVIWKY